MRISDWSSDVCSSDLPVSRALSLRASLRASPRDSARRSRRPGRDCAEDSGAGAPKVVPRTNGSRANGSRASRRAPPGAGRPVGTKSQGIRPEPQASLRSEEHTSELQSLMRISYDVFCLKKNKKKKKESETT